MRERKREEEGRRTRGENRGRNEGAENSRMILSDEISPFGPSANGLSTAGLSQPSLLVPARPARFLPSGLTACLAVCLSASVPGCGTRAERYKAPRHQGQGCRRDSPPRHPINHERENPLHDSRITCSGGGMAVPRFTGLLQLVWEHHRSQGIFSYC